MAEVTRIGPSGAEAVRIVAFSCEENMKYGNIYPYKATN
jgi:hypothetical protein